MHCPYPGCASPRVHAGPEQATGYPGHSEADWAHWLAHFREQEAVLRRNWHGDRDKLCALREWATAALDGPLLEQALAIFERDFTRAEDGEAT